MFARGFGSSARDVDEAAQVAARAAREWRRVPVTKRVWLKRAASVAQNPYNMGKFGIESAVKVLNGRTVPKRIDTGTTLVTKQNAARYAK